MRHPSRPLTLIARSLLLGAGAGALLATLYTLLAIPLFGLLLLTNIPAGKALDALLGVGAFAVCAGPFALLVGILPAALIGALAGLPIGLLSLALGEQLTPRRGALIGLGVAVALVASANVLLGPSLLRMEEGSFGRAFLYLCWLGGPSIVGAFYLLLALMNMYFVLINPGAIGAMTQFPFPATPDTIQAFVDGWSPFAFEVLGIGTFMLWAARNPRRYLGAVWLLVWLELLHGVLDDIYLIARGYDAGGYIAFIVIHLLIIVTGVLFGRQGEREAA
ncbi:MAG: hypothetical protein FJ011_23185 [Chloroflexi bacterium]|nr:hypothetical protein [Chloroflexota bacterium]